MAVTRIQISPRRIVADALVVWHEHGSEVDVVMDFKSVSFAPGTLDAVYAFHVLDHYFESDIMPCLENWTKLLKPGGELFVVVDDFEYIARLMLSGDIGIEQFNGEFSHPYQFSKDLLIKWMSRAGFPDGSTVLWFADVQGMDGKIIFKKQEHELVIVGKKV